MRKKIFSALMLVAFFAATSSTLVSCKDYDEEISAVNTRIDNLDDDLSADIAALETQLNTAKTQLEAAIAANKTLIESLQTKHDADVATLNGKIAENNQKIVDLTARVAALESAMTTAQAAIKNLEDNKADKSALNAAIADAAATHAALTGDIKKLQEADEAIITAYKAADDALEAKITAAYQAADKELAAAYAAADKNLQLQIEANKNAITALKQFQTEQLANNTAQQGAIDKNTGDIATNAGNISKNTQAISDLAAKEAEDIQKLNENLTAFKSEVAETYATKTALAEGMEEANRKINAVNDKVNLLNVLISKRLTSIVFAPNKYIDGVECIEFASVEYKSWGKADEEKKAEKAEFLRDFPTDSKYSGDGVVTAKSYLIDNGSKTISYYVSPTGVKAENIETLEFIDATATNDLTRAADGVKLKALSGWTVEGGKLNVKVTRNNANKINNTNTDFTIVALKAQIAKAQLTEGETEAYVYSDWARLQESIKNVRIHNAEKAFKTATAGEPADAHFYAFSDIYTEFQKNTNPSSAVALHYYYPYDALHIAKEVQYNKTLDLNSLDAVCFTDGEQVKDYAAYGLKFEHNLVEYNVKNENNTSDATNQAKYAKITKDENGHDILSSKAADGEIDTPNRDAIGKTPVIQVVLKDTVNNQVVDVRFYRIEWTLEKPEVRTYDVVNEVSHDWTCNTNSYQVKILEAAVNKFYAWASSDGQGYDQITFHTLYEIDPTLYSTEEAARTSSADGTTHIGTVVDNWSNSQSTQAHNITATFDGKVELTQSLYDGTPVVKEGFIAYKRKSDLAQRQYVIFVLPVKTTISYNGNKVAANAAYNQTAWDFQGGSSAAYSVDNVKKYVTSNPTLTNNPLYGEGAGFTDAQFINDLLNNYVMTATGNAPTTIENLLANATDGVEFVFDNTRLDILPGTTSDWSVSADGKILSYKNTPAATIESDLNGAKAYVKLYEGVEGHEAGKKGKPSDGALLLVNYTADETTDVNTIKNAVPVKLVGTQCDLALDMDKFLVRFEKPLTTINPNVTLEVKDQITTTNIGGTDYPGSVAAPAISGLFGLKETFGQYRTVLGAGATPGLDKWYIVGEPDFETGLANAKTNLKKDGTIGATCETKVTDLKDSDGNQYWLVKIINCADGQKHFQFQNQNGNALKQDIKIQFDVTISTKWLKNIKYTVTVTVKANTNPGGAK